MNSSSNYSLKPHNTFGLDVTADNFVEYQSVEELREAIPGLQKPMLHIGQGSNILFCGDFHGTVLHSRILDLEIVDDRPEGVSVRVGSGMVWDDFVAWCVTNGLYGAENLSGIPGEVGASAVQNIGAYGAEAKDIIERVEVLDALSLERRCFDASECGYGYRTSIFKQTQFRKYFVTHVVYRLSRQWKPNLSYAGLAKQFEGKAEPSAADIRSAVMALRDSKLPDPKVLGNAGSFFVNSVVSDMLASTLSLLYPDMPQYPAADGKVKLSAAWLIEHAGWKGADLGPAGVYEKQPLVLVNRGGATGEDIVRLAVAIIQDVYDTFGVELHPEVNKIG